jgi:hypothetical protein
MGIQWIPLNTKWARPWLFGWNKCGQDAVSCKGPERHNEEIGGLAPRKAKEWGGRKQIEPVCYLRMACWVILGKRWKSQPRKVARGRLSTLSMIKGSFHLKLGAGWYSFGWAFGFWKAKVKKSLTEGTLKEEEPSRLHIMSSIWHHAQWRMNLLLSTQIEKIHVRSCANCVCTQSRWLCSTTFFFLGSHEEILPKFY